MPASRTASGPTRSVAREGGSWAGTRRGTERGNELAIPVTHPPTLDAHVGRDWVAGTGMVDEWGLCILCVRRPKPQAREILTGELQILVPRLFFPHNVGVTLVTLCQ